MTANTYFFSRSSLLGKNRGGKGLKFSTKNKFGLINLVVIGFQMFSWSIVVKFWVLLPTKMQAVTQDFSIRFSVVGKSFGVGREGKILKPGPLRMHFQHSGAKLECLDRTQASLNYLAFLMSDSTWILYSNWGNFQRKVGRKFTWYSPRISPTTSSYWKPWWQSSKASCHQYKIYRAKT